jgi:lipoprotein-anchoring transpeptidase ErfK/SrfK
MVRVREYGASVATRWLGRIAVLTAAGAIGASSQAEAALYYWSDFDSGFSQPSPTVTQRRQKPRLRQGKKIAAPQKEAGKPQGPLIIAISIQKQNLKIYDAKGFFAETPISTGMPGHPTPMGVFSVIQKHKLHHSNIYSGAPMPYMQRITWSGVAMHAGVLPGYPASHGCIRMPMAFAVKMWGWTRMGARVVVAPGEMSPADFSHPLLMAQKVVPQPAVADEPNPDAPPAAKTDKASNANGTIKPAISAASLELRSTVGHDSGVKSAMGAPPATPLTQTADARAALPATNAPVTMTDATSSGANPSPRNKAAARGETASSDDKPVETRSSEAAAAEIEIKSAETGVTTQTSGDAVRTGRPANDARTEAPKADASSSNEKFSEKPDGNVKAVTDIRPAAPDVKKDQARLDTEKAAVSKPDPAIAAPPKRSGQIAAFVSLKDSKLYVRQNFSPLFEAPVTIAPSDRPLGTHVFTAQVDKNDANVLHWSVVSLPVPARYAESRDEDERASRRRRIAGAAQNKAIPAPNSPAEALDRLTIPPDAMARISEALSTGGSIIVSDQGISSGETGAGTDFIVSLR